MAAIDPSRKDLTRREFMARAAATGISVSAAGSLLAACGSKKKAAGGGAMDTKLPAEITVLNWTEYIAPKVLKSFQKKTGVKVTIAGYNSVPEALKKVQGGAVCDVVFVTSAYLRAFRDAGFLRPLDMSLLPNFANVTDPTLSKPPYDNGDDGKCSVPYMFGTTGFAVRLDKVPNPKESWEMLWDKRYKGGIGMLDDSGEVMAVGMFMTGKPAGANDQASIDGAVTKLIEQKPLVKHYSSVEITADIVNGLPLRHCWDGDAILAINQVGLNKVRYILPEEGFAGWADTICVHAKAPSPYAAHLFLDYLLDSKIAGDNANYCGYEPAPSTADPYIKSLVQRAMRPTAETMSRAQFVEVTQAATDINEAAFKRIREA